MRSHCDSSLTGCLLFRLVGGCNLNKGQQRGTFTFEHEDSHKEENTKSGEEARMESERDGFKRQKATDCRIMGGNLEYLFSF